MAETSGSNGGARRQQRVNWFGILIQIGLMYMAYRYFFGGAPVTTIDPETGLQLEPHRPKWHPNTKLYLRVYLSESEFFNVTHLDEAIWEEDGLKFNYDASNERHKDYIYEVSNNVMHNASLFVHIYITKDQYSHIKGESNYRPGNTIHTVHPLNVYLPPPKRHQRKNLISGEMEEETGDNILITKNDKDINVQNKELISYWKPNVTVNIVYDFTVHARGSIPAPILSHIKLDPTGSYFPIIFLNEFWLMREQLFPINETTQELQVHLHFNTLSLWKFMMMVQMEQSFSMQESLGAAEGESDEVKRMLFETNPYLLGLTIAVSLLHSVFDFLAFKNDIQYWRNRKTVEGLSVKSIFFNLFMQIVILLYLIDNDTSWLIIISTGVGILIEAWKITKATDVEYSWPAGSYPRVSFNDKDSYQNETKMYDDMAFKYLSWALIPLVIGYSIYSLYYQSHKSWYSWVLGSLVGCIYTFGFIMMTPQLFINYKLKSVAHLPWKTFTYKALNTFIDDLFAFIIRMPTMHRLACFRDDLVFFILLYQRWIYPVDPKRRNEFGQTGEALTTEVVSRSSDSTEEEKEVKEVKEVKEKTN